MFDNCLTFEYIGTMLNERIITTREFLRNFKKFRDMLTSGNAKQISVSAGGEVLEVKLRSHPALTGAELARRVQSLKNPIRIERPDIFSGFMERIEKRKKEARRKNSKRQK